MYLVRLGDELRRLRHHVGLNRQALGQRCLLHHNHIGKLELGYRRTRRSTLGRIAAALEEISPDLGPVEELVARLCGLAGPALAPETDYPRQVERTLRRKMRRREKTD